MTYGPTRHHRRSIRLPAYDYAQAGAYFVTIVCRDRELLLVDPRLREVVEETWLWLGDRYEFVELDEHVVVPNHLHGIIVINDTCRGGSRAAPTRATNRKPLGQLVGAFKTVSTKRINKICGTLGQPVWQRNYYEHVIRDGEELNDIRQYIVDNPLRWAEDRENPTNLGEPNVGAHGRAPLQHPDGLTCLTP